MYVEDVRLPTRELRGHASTETKRVGIRIPRWCVHLIIASQKRINFVESLARATGAST